MTLANWGSESMIIGIANPARDRAVHAAPKRIANLGRGLKIWFKPNFTGVFEGFGDSKFIILSFLKKFGHYLYGVSEEVYTGQHLNILLKAF